MSYPSFITMGLKTMMIGEDSIPLMIQGRQAAGAVKSMKGIYEGDKEIGFLYAGQCVGGIQEIPTVKELIDRIMVEAEQVIGELNAKVVRGA